MMKSFAKLDDNRIACFDDEVDRDRFLDHSIGAKYTACSKVTLPQEVIDAFSKNTPICFIGETTYLNGSLVLRHALDT